MGMKIAGAPISWGVCEVPGWGHQLPADRVLSEMRELGLAATEFGPEGYLNAKLIADHGLTAAGAFVPVVLHEPGTEATIDTAVDGLAGTDAVLVLAAASGTDGYESRPELDGRGWATLLANLDRAAARAWQRGFTATLHPHVGTMIERTGEVERVIDGCGVSLCLDTGHLLIGGTDPAALARDHADRIGHVHLKDVNAGLAKRVRDGELGYQEAVKNGLYRPLGDGDVDIAGVVAALEPFAGWYVLEQDTILADDMADPVRDVQRSLDYLRSLA
jgi:inosose dehydratase